MTGRGVFGKSGKMNIAIHYIYLNGRPIPVEGTFRQEGESNTVPTIAGAAVVPVVAGDIAGRRYTVLGIFAAEIRKATVFSPSPSQQHVYREPWERAERSGADAVINAQYGTRASPV